MGETRNEIPRLREVGDIRLVEQSHLVCDEASAGPIKSEVGEANLLVVNRLAERLDK